MEQPKRKVNVTATSLDGIKEAVSRLAEIIDAPQSHLPAYGRSPGTGLPHIEKDDRGFHWVVAERGHEFERRTTHDPHDLLYWIFDSVTFEMAAFFEVRNRQENQDSRRIIYRKQLELLEDLDSSWKERAQDRHKQVLAQYPFDDNSGPRYRLAMHLKDQGFSREAAEQIARLHYPPPKDPTTEECPNPHS